MRGTTMGRTIEASDILAHMQVPKLPGVFVLGCFERRITFYSQQVRALNLLYALSASGRLQHDSHVLVIGAGAAGLTAAAAARRLGARVTLLERGDEVMPLLRGNHTRWLHPHIYDWPAPGSENPRAGLPILDWQANQAGDVVRQLDAQWKNLCEESRIDFHRGVRNLKCTSGQGSEHTFTWNTKPEASPHATRFEEGSFDIVILAVGFGREKMLEGVKSPFYWADDDLHQRPPKTPCRYLISGTGDGGLIDLLRVQLREFRHEQLVSEFLSGSELDPIKEQLLEIEKGADSMSLPDLYRRYRDIQAPTVDTALGKRLRTDTSAMLNSQESHPLSPGASGLNRFLVSRLLALGVVPYQSGTIQAKETGTGSIKVSFASGEHEEEFDRVVIRHGPEGALEPHGSWLGTKALEELRARSQLDQTRSPLWPPDFFTLRPPGTSPTTLARAAVRDDPPPHRLPPPGNNFGREALTKQLVERLLASPPRPTTVLGAPGIGKSTLTLAALHAPEVQRHYDPHRYFIRLDGVSTASGLNSKLAQALGLPPGPDLPARMATFFGGKPALLILDNAETPWEAEPRETEALLTELASLPRLALLLSVRGREQPSLPGMGRPLVVPVLELEAARELFLSIAWNVDHHHPRLDELLEEQQGLALAVTLLAHAAQGADLDLFHTQWQRMRSRLLVRREAQDRLGSIAVSFEMSLQSPRMTTGARRLLSVHSRLPAGVALEDLEPLFPEDPEAPSVLQKTGLAFSENQRLRMLAPIREYVRSEHPPAPEDWARVTRHYSALAREQGPRVGTRRGKAALERLAVEVPNLQVVLLAELQSAQPQAAIDSALALNNFMRFSGYGSLDVLKSALEQAVRLHDTARVAQCTYTQGQLLQRRSQHEQARELFQKALPLFEQLEDPHGMARCLQSLGNLALDDRELDKAQECFERALPLRQQLKDSQGIGNCLHGLGKAALSRNRQEEARGYFNQALHLFEEIDNTQGRAHCLRSLGELDADVHRLDEARGLFEKVGDVRGVGHCLRGMADIARRNNQLQRADELYGQALRHLRQVGSVRGVANCLLGIGYRAHESGHPQAARQSFEQALENYRHVGDKAHEQECLRQLALP